MYYFAYGMLTCPDTIGNAEYIGNGIINGYQFEFARYANAFRSSGTMNVVVWEITDEKLVELDAIEGYPDFYNRVKVRCNVDGQSIIGWLYTMTKDSREYLIGEPPSIDYMQKVTNGYRHAKLSTDQIKQALSKLR